MKARGFVFLLFVSLFCVSHLHASPHLLGRWISTEIERKVDESIGAGWTVTFRDDGTFTEEIDEGFGIVEIWSGTYQLDGPALSMHRAGFDQAWSFSVVHDPPELSIARISNGKERFVVRLTRSDALNPALANLPHWPKSKAEAVAVLSQKMDQHSLEELASTSKSDLIGKYHFGLGLYIRNAFGIWRGNKDLWEDLTHGKPTHPDDLSGIIIEALWEDLNSKLTPEERSDIQIKRALVARKRATYMKLESECQTQLSGAQGQFEACYAKHGLPSKNPRVHDPFFKLVVDRSGRVREIIFFEGAASELKPCLAKIIDEFRFSSFGDDEFVTLYILEFPYCRVAERDKLSP